MNIGTFDLATFEATVGDARKTQAEALDHMCRTTGFLVVSGHGIAPETIADMWDAANAFFAQEPEAKQVVRSPVAGGPYGYLGPNQEALAKSKGVDTPPDLKESFNGRSRPLKTSVSDPAARAFAHADTPWPDLPGFRDAWDAYYAAVEDLGVRIIRAFAQALNLPAEHFAPFCTDPASALRALNYPATLGEAEAGQQRAGAHTDYGMLTILLPQQGSQGLQVRHDGTWIDVTAPDNCFVINIGDLMARWTADRWVSTLHRVVAKPDQPKRLSLAYFYQPDWDAVIEPLDGADTYPPIAFGDYLMGKFKSASG
jgi:isopenicillin N synthase-like dioxygenase